MSASFHSKTGSLVTLSNNNKTAQRNQPVQEFNNGVIFSNEPLKDAQLFEVRIDRKVIIAMVIGYAVKSSVDLLV